MQEQNKIDSSLANPAAFSATMAKKELGGKNSPVATRLRDLRESEDLNATAFAARLNLSTQRWNNFENGFPLSREVAIRLVRLIPGLTLDWLYLGRTEGLTVALARRLEAAQRRKSGAG